MSELAIATGIPAPTSSVTSAVDRRLTLLLFFLPIALLTFSVLWINGGSLMFTLDDPYIHIDLAKRIFSGHYGINTNEYSAPSSSIIWPLLLAPFTPLGKWMLWVPLILNIGFSFLTFSLFTRLLKDIKFEYQFFILAGWFLQL